MPPAPRLLAIDLVKGCAILWVLRIHSHPPAETYDRLFLYLVNQAVPIFVVLFGLNAELWWRGREEGALAAWYASRARRVLVPMWAALAVWWALALTLRPPDVTLTRVLPLEHALGWLSRVGTGWFVTLLVQLVAVFPLLHAVARRAGIGVVLVAGFACTLACVHFRFALVEMLVGGGRDFFIYWVFSPRLFAHVAFGMWLAPRVARPGRAESSLAAAGFVSAVAGAEGLLGARLVPYATALVPLPLTALLLSLFQVLPRVPGVTTALAWLGRSSYGLYLGQLLTHNAFMFVLGLGLYQRLDLWLYSAILLAGGLFFVWLGETLGRAAGVLRAPPGHAR